MVTTQRSMHVCRMYMFLVQDSFSLSTQKMSTCWSTPFWSCCRSETVASWYDWRAVYRAPPRRNVKTNELSSSYSTLSVLLLSIQSHSSILPATGDIDLWIYMKEKTSISHGEISTTSVFFGLLFFWRDLLREKCLVFLFVAHDDVRKEKITRPCWVFGHHGSGHHNETQARGTQRLIFPLCEPPSPGIYTAWCQTQCLSQDINKYVWVNAGCCQYYKMEISSVARLSRSPRFVETIWIILVRASRNSERWSLRYCQHKASLEFLERYCCMMRHDSNKIRWV